jgi:aminoglycoside/choline kinase family phosphotransferase
VKQENLIKLFETWSGEKALKYEPLPQSGSYREYYRISSPRKTALGVFNSDNQENIAFLSFSKHFLSKGLNVPKIYLESLENDSYLIEDLGDTTLFSFLTEERKSEGWSENITNYYRQVLEALPSFQVHAGKDLDYSVCYPRAKFDKQSMMWDLNYFKYYFLKLAKIPFDEQALESDFHTFIDYLLGTQTDFFLYRDFQSRNIMLRDGRPYFIDYQGGRRGALQYDLASLLYDAKADIPQQVRSELLAHYIQSLKKQKGFAKLNEPGFIQYFFGYVFIRIMQAMGAYGFRGFYEKKEHFLKSIPYALENLRWLLDNVHLPVNLPALSKVWERLTQSEALKKYSGDRKSEYALTVSVNSFSYKKEIPRDSSGNGGGFVFDCRAIHNPGRYDKYKLLTGKDPEVIEFLEKESEVGAFLDHVKKLIDSSVEVYTKRKFTNLMISFGCTGGQHRSVYCAEKIAHYLSGRKDVEVILTHTELNNRSR